MDEQTLATVEILGALTYGQLRAFEVTARAIRSAPDARAADRVADFAGNEYSGYRMLRDRLVELTDLDAAVLDRQKDRFDDYFDEAPVDDWLHACTFFAIGLPLAADFIRQIAPHVPDQRTREVLLAALTERDRFERFARDELVGVMEVDAEKREEIRHVVADVLGRALTGFQGAVADTDALRVLLGAGDEGPDATIRKLAVTVLDGHRRRMLHLGIDDLDE